MKRNVTVSLDEEMARWVRVQAAERDVSVSRFVADILVERRRRAEGYDAARAAFMAREPGPLRSPGAPIPTREELHERADLKA